MDELRTIAVDGETFAVRFRGWHVDLDVVEPAGRLAPWRLGLHAEALAACSGPDELDAAAFADAVLGACWSGEAPGPRPLALWWASGAEVDVHDGVDVGLAQIRLRPWTFAARIHALWEAGALDERPRLDVARWLLARVASNIASVEPAVAIASLPAAPVLAAIDALDAPPDGLALSTLPAPLRATIQRVCRALGWTPSQVLAAPAAEIDRVLELFDEPAPALTSRPAPLQGLAARPDAIVFQFEPDEEEQE